MFACLRLPPGRALDTLLPYLGDCRSLRQLCRYIIRSCLGSHYLPRITPLLPLPQQLREFILLQRWLTTVASVVDAPLAFLCIIVHIYWKHIKMVPCPSVCPSICLSQGSVHSSSNMWVNSKAVQQQAMCIIGCMWYVGCLNFGPTVRRSNILVYCCLQCFDAVG